MNSDLDLLLEQIREQPYVRTTVSKRDAEKPIIIIGYLTEDETIYEKIFNFDGETYKQRLHFNIHGYDSLEAYYKSMRSIYENKESKYSIEFISPSIKEG